MADELPTADRDALTDAVTDALDRTDCEHGNRFGCIHCNADWAVDALLPHIAVLLDRARQQGRAEAAEAIEERREAIRFCSTQSALVDLHSSLRRALVYFDEAAALARGSQTAPSATENAETGGGA